MKSKILILGLLCLFFKVSAQQNITVQPLKVGDKVPDASFTNILNYKGEAMKLSDFHNKLVILNFWSTSCGSCIAKFPEEVGLQKKFKDSLQIVFVDSKNTRDTKQRVVKFFEAYHPSYKLLPSIVEDTLLSKYFPHQTVGYYVWIYNNVILTMADEQDLTEKNIRSYLAGKQLVFPQTEDIPYDQSKPIFLTGNGGEAPAYLYRSVITPYKPGLHSSSRFIMTDKDQCSGYTFINFTKLSLFLSCHPELDGIDNNRLIFKLVDPEDFSSDSTSEYWKQRNLLTYEASFPAVPMLEAMKRMRGDLEKVLPLKIDSQFRDTECFVITKEQGFAKRPSDLIIKTAGFKDEDFLRDFPISFPLGWLNTKSKIPFIDESGFTGTIRMTYTLDDLSVNQIVEKLKVNSLKVTKEVRKLRFYVISDKQSTNLIFLYH